MRKNYVYYSMLDDGQGYLFDDEPIETAEVKERCHKGDMWRLGDHLLLCGDSTNREDVERLMDGTQADLVFTDPPYGLGFSEFENDKLNNENLLAFNKEWVPLALDSLKEHGAIYIWGCERSIFDLYAFVFRPMINKKEVTFKNLIVWFKGVVQGQNWSGARSYMKGAEYALFFIKGNEPTLSNATAADFFDGFTPILEYLKSEMEKCGGVCKSYKALQNYMGRHYFSKSQWVFPTEGDYKRLQEYGRPFGAFLKSWQELKKEKENAETQGYWDKRDGKKAGLSYFDGTVGNFNNVWQIQPASNQERALAGGHPTLKPIELCKRGILCSSREGETALDLFGGSGSILIACEETGRKCRMMELTPHWCDVIINRYETLTGKKGEKIK